MQIGNQRMRRIFFWSAGLSALLFIAGTASATQDVVLTAVKGDTSIQDRDLGERAELADDQKLETGADAGCSLLVDDNAVVQICGQTRVSFTTDPKRGHRIVNLEAGDLQLIVEPREADERIEIHTPAAIATILGTVVFISVDPLTGATTITSSESRVNIRDWDDTECTPRGLPAEPGIPECAEGTTIGDLEQLTVVPGERQQPVKQLSQQQIDELSGCLLDFHDVALKVDRSSQETRAARRLVAVDVAAAEALSFEYSGPTIILEGGIDTVTEVEVELSPTDDSDQEKQILENQIVEDMLPPTPPETPDDIPDCGGIPGEQCGF